ncbi:MAG TPA: amidohydrolase family protein [Candidatus Baltobacteraceae bacterium]|jgi:imidazolonepropionase-like amidohydrolase|nr:amidohydrolase family protein [Candidatus Baltobacteraceae bacterium]
MQPKQRVALALVSATIFARPDAEPLRDGVVVIEDERIAAVGPRVSTAVPPDAQILHCSGSTITAGFWNSHVHFFERKWMNARELPPDELETQLREYLQYGFTSVFDLSSDRINTQVLRERIETGQVDGPRILTTGEGLVPAGAVPDEVVRRMMGIMDTAMPQVHAADHVADAVQTLLENGVDGVKFFLSGPPSSAAQALSQDVIAPGVAAAHKRNKPVFAHVNTSQDVITALRSGVDVVAHTTPNSGTWDDEILALVRKSGAGLTPTLNLWKTYLRHDRISMQDRLISAALAQLRAWIDAGGEVIFGTDAGAVDIDPLPEYRLMSRAGMTFEQILTSLTTAPCRRFGESRHGRVAEGYVADLNVLRGDPCLDIGALADVRYAIRNGKIVYGDGLATDG